MTLWDDKFQIIKPMLAFSSKPFSSPNYIFEYKYDGTRCIAYVKGEEIKFLNRRGFFFEQKYPELTSNIKIKGTKAILDGEIVILKGEIADFNQLQEREQTNSDLRIKILADINPATFIVFDILHLDGKDLIDLPLMERKKILKDVLFTNERIKMIDFVEEKGEDLFEEAKNKGMEGIMAKLKDSKYEMRRSYSWLKIKVKETADLVILGYVPGKGERELGAIIVGAYENNKLISMGKVGTGFNEDEAKIIMDYVNKNPGEPLDEIENAKWCKPGLVCEVEFMEITSDKKLRAPSFKRLRFDKDAKECTLEDII